jgi:hypothetical protein
MYTTLVEIADPKATALPRTKLVPVIPTSVPPPDGPETGRWP